MGPDGRVFRDGNVVFAQMKGKSYLLDEPGVECLNPEAPEAERVYQCAFRKSPVYLADEYGLAVQKHLGGANAFVFGPNGYSQLKPAEERAWGVGQGAYDFICERVLECTEDHFRETFPAANSMYVTGASAMGIDRVTGDFAERRGRPQLGFSCPAYLFYVRDDGRPIVAMPSVAEYADAFGRTANVLLTLNGRKHTYESDFASSMRYHSYVIALNVMQMISSNGGPPDIDGDGRVQDAVAHLQKRMRIIGNGFVRAPRPQTFEEVMRSLCDEITDIGRRSGLLAPKVAWETAGRA